MARVKLGAMFADLRGKIQNMVVSVAKGGVHYVKSIPAVVSNVNSLAQANIRRLLHEAAVDWSSLTPAEQAEWAAVAVRCAGLAKEPGGGIEVLVPPIGFDGSGFNAYAAFRTRARRSSVSLAAFNTAWRLGVATEAQPTSPAAGAFTCAAGSANIVWVDPITSDTAALICVRMRSKEKVYHNQILDNIALAVQTYTETGARSAKGESIPFTDTTGGILLCQLQTINPSGWASSGSATKSVVIA